MTDETNVMKGLHFWVLLLMFKLNKELTCLWSLRQQINTLFIFWLPFLPGTLSLHCSTPFNFFFKALSLHEFITHMFSAMPVLRLYPVFPIFPWFLILSTVVYSVLSLQYLYRSKHHNSTRNMKLSHQDVSCLSVSTFFILLLLLWNASSKIWAFLSL